MTDSLTFDARDPDLDQPVEQPEPPTSGDELDVDAPLSSDLEDLREAISDELSADPEAELLWLPVPRRDGYELGFSTKVDHEKLQQFRRSSQVGKRGNKDLDDLSFACKVLAFQCEEIRRKGETITYRGDPVTFRTPEFLSTLGADRAVAGVRKLYSRDADALAAVAEVLEAAGYDDTDQAAEDPTLL